MKINGPALGYEVTSLDPADAPNAAAREEIKKLNLSLEMGDNVMIVIDDIPALSSEFLQKFISLCDAQRKIEGVYNGQPRTYDLRGRKVAVVMAGNPYTESGDKFKIPDMLANRADTYNLGDIAGQHADIFMSSYLEERPYFELISAAPRRQKPQRHSFSHPLRTDGSGEGVEFEGRYSPEEINEMVLVMKALIRIRDVILRVNQNISFLPPKPRITGQNPPFRLQGSYRNMNRLAEKIIPVMNEQEIDSLIFEHYKNEAQTLTTGAEANLLKFKEIRGILSDTERERWVEIKSTYKRKQLFSDSDPSDPLSRVIVQMSAFTQGLDQIRHTLGENMSVQSELVRQQINLQGQPQSGEFALATGTLESLRQMASDLRLAIEAAANPIVAPLGSTSPIKKPKSITLVNEDGSPAPDGTSSHGTPQIEPSAQKQPENQPNPNYQIEVKYSVPEAFTQIIQQQFALMQAWTQTAFANQKLQSKELKGLHEEVSKLLAGYQTLLGWMGNSGNSPQIK